MRVLNLTYGPDVAGAGYGIADAFRRHPQDGIVVRSTAQNTGHWLNYPPDLRWADAARYWQLADVVHLRDSAKALRRLGHKPFVMHHHGTRYRNHAATYDAYCAEHGGRQVVSTLDLLAYGDHLTWCPQAHDLDVLATYRQPQPGRRLRVGHAPTNRAIKDTEAFLTACREADVEPVLVERQAWSKCLEVKGTVDVYYDQVQLGYGNNAIEAWAMGIPVIAGAADDTLETMLDRFIVLPFCPATTATLADALAAMRDEATREHWAARGHAHAARWHDGAETVRVLAEVYRSL